MQIGDTAVNPCLRSANPPAQKKRQPRSPRSLRQSILFLGRWIFFFQQIVHRYTVGEGGRQLERWRGKDYRYSEGPRFGQSVKPHRGSVNRVNLLKGLASTNHPDRFRRHAHLRQSGIFRQAAGPIHLDGKILGDRDIQRHIYCGRMYLVEGNARRQNSINLNALNRP